MRVFCGFIAIIFGAITAKGQVVFSSLPLDGINGRDFFMVNYVDHDTSTAVGESWCGDKTYNGHQGTDFVLRSFKTMDSGVTVRAVASGRVFFASDTQFDRNKHTNSLGFGNYVAINHQNQYYTYYAHIKKHSLLVSVGDSVTAGQALAKVGCSGNCTDPHLHLEVWNNTDNVDPFTGPCHTASSLWAAQPTYDTVLKVIDAGFVPYVPNLDTLRERYALRDTFYPGRDTTVCFWVQMQGLRTGDIESIYWYSPSGAYWFSYADTMRQNWWYYYNWSYINVPDSPGIWTAKQYVNTQLVQTRTFYIAKPNSISATNEVTTPLLWPNPCHDLLHLSGTQPGDRIVIRDITGRTIKELSADTMPVSVSDLPKGMYLLRCGSNVSTFRRE